MPHVVTLNYNRAWIVFDDRLQPVLDALMRCGVEKPMEPSGAPPTLGQALASDPVDPESPTPATREVVTGARVTSYLPPDRARTPEPAPSNEPLLDPAVTENPPEKPGEE